MCLILLIAAVFLNLFLLAFALESYFQCVLYIFYIFLRALWNSFGLSCRYVPPERVFIYFCLRHNQLWDHTGFLVWGFPGHSGGMNLNHQPAWGLECGWDSLRGFVPRFEEDHFPKSRAEVVTFMEKYGRWEGRMISRTRSSPWHLRSVILWWGLDCLHWAGRGPRLLCKIKPY